MLQTTPSSGLSATFSPDAGEKEQESRLAVQIFDEALQVLRMPQRFVILKHDHPFLHWDFLLEEETTARAWRLLRTPCPEEPIAAEPLSAHRLFYLDYEGPVSGDRGHVTRAFAGEYVVESSMNDVIRLQLSGIEFASSATIQTLSDGRVFVTFVGERGM